MLRLFLAAMLAVITMPAQAATFIKYTATGNGLEFENPGVWSPIPVYVKSTAYYLVGPDACSMQFQCTVTTTAMTFRVQPEGDRRPFMALLFSDGIAAPRTTADAFTGGEADWLGGYGYLTALTVEFVEIADPEMPTGWVSIETRAQAIPEPTTWMLMLGGFGLLGGALRRHGAPAAWTGRV